MPVKTLGELKSEVLDRLEANSRYYTEAEIVAALNEAVRISNLQTGFIQTSQTITSDAERHIYDVPVELLIATRISFDGEFLQRTGLHALSQEHPRWLKETTATEGQRVMKWIPVGIRKFGIYPADADGSATISVHGIADPVALAGDSDELKIPAEFGDLISDYAAHVLMLKSGGKIAADAMFLYQGYLSRMKELSRFVSKVNPTLRVEVEQPR